MAATIRPRKGLKMRIILITTFPRLYFICGSVLLFLALVSILAGRLLDLERFPHSSRALSLTSLHHDQELRTNISDASRLRLLDFEVPTEGDPSISDIWSSRLSKFYHGCSTPSHQYMPVQHDKYFKHYLMIAASGGLNQQRTGGCYLPFWFAHVEFKIVRFRISDVARYYCEGEIIHLYADTKEAIGHLSLLFSRYKITDAVVVARMLNATLVVPKLDQKSFWKDKSDFGDIFDVDWFIHSLSKDVVIIKELPQKARKQAGRPPTMRVPRKCTPHCYESRVLPVLRKRRVIELTKFDYRLANKLPTDLQKLRCKVNYHALRFTSSITEMGQLLVDRMREKSTRFVALHLRFESDMLAFSGCYFGGGDDERKKLGAIRKRWKSLHTSNPEKERRHGKCPLTPEEVGLMLRALGFGKEVSLYVASGEVYGGEESLATLKSLFPNFYTKDTLASKQELEPFSSYSSRMAALDYIVCDQSDVFVTNNNGNMARMLAGRRRYFGHKRTIRPNAKKLSSLFLNRQNMSWHEFALKLRHHQKGFMGEPNEVRPGRGEFHEFPLTCICENKDAMGKVKTTIQTNNKSTEESFSDLQDQNEMVQMDNESVSDASDGFGKDDSEEGSQLQQAESEEEPEVEDMLSD